MPCGIEGEDPTPEQIQEIRNKILEYYSENGTFDPADVARLQNDDKYAKRFFKHIFEKEGNQVDLAVKMIISSFEWRKDFGVREFGDEIVLDGAKSKGALFVRNRDKDGKQMLIFQVRKHIKGAENMTEVKKFFIYLLEKIDKEDDGDLVTLFFDCSGCGLKNMDMEFTQYMINVFKDYYPWYLNYILVFDMPWVLNAAWKIIKSWMPASGVKKVKFLTKNNIGEYVDEDQRPPEWGGTDDWDFLEASKSKAAVNGIGEEEAAKKKTVSFSGEVKQSDDVNGTETIAPLAAPSSAMAAVQTTQENLLFLNPSEEIIFTPSPQGDHLGKVEVRNVSSSPVIFKIKTTSPEKYRVRPSMANLGVGASTFIEIHVQTPATIAVVKDKFLITAVSVNEEGLSHSHIAEIMKTMKPGSQYRLRCAYESSATNNPAVSSFSGPYSALTQSSNHETNDAKQVQTLMRKVTVLINGQKELTEGISSLKRLVWILTSLTLVLFLLNSWQFYYNSGEDDIAQPPAAAAKSEL